MKQTLNSVPSRGSWLSRMFSTKVPLQEVPTSTMEPKICGVSFDEDRKIHMAKNQKHQEVIDFFNKWMNITEGTFSLARENALIGLFDIADVNDRIKEYSRNVCPNYGIRLDLAKYQGKIKNIMDHTYGLHLNRVGLDHFGIPVFDFELLGFEGGISALADIRNSIQSVMEIREGKITELRSAYYIFQGFRMLRYMERITREETDWKKLSGIFPMVPVPGRLILEKDLSDIEMLEFKAFNMHLNKTMFAKTYPESRSDQV